ncbi:unnamed protein product [Pleuronectes platessa]|uniref:Uncharacterized protein n=1 Tax=Pleuronectes platessa TaxID=8262 RepID=A0A9N7TIH7_PLEPL|nr:unnamed protein product [Pleuronectes platessa]
MAYGSNPEVWLQSLILTPAQHRGRFSAQVSNEDPHRASAVKHHHDVSTVQVPLQLHPGRRRLVVKHHDIVPRTRTERRRERESASSSQSFISRGEERKLQQDERRKKKEEDLLQSSVLNLRLRNFNLRLQISSSSSCLCHILLQVVHIPRLFCWEDALGPERSWKISGKRRRKKRRRRRRLRWGHVGLGLIVLKVGCRMSIPISTRVGLEGRADEQMMGRTDGREEESEWDVKSGGVRGRGRPGMDRLTDGREGTTCEED